MALAMYVRAGITPPASLVNGQPEDSQTTSEVPSVLLKPTWVTAANMNSTVIADQFVPGATIHHSGRPMVHDQVLWAVTRG